jgi:oligopeptidase B
MTAGRPGRVRGPARQTALWPVMCALAGCLPTSEPVATAPPGADTAAPTDTTTLIDHAPEPISRMTDPNTPDATRPPVAEQRPFELQAHGQTRIDPYYWLRDDDRADPGVLAYLQAENAWTEAQLSDSEALRRELFDELKSRLKPDDASVPVFDRGYWYYLRYEAGREYAVHARRQGSLDAPEQIVLDENAQARGHQFYDVGAISVSDDGRLLAYTEDTRSRGEYTLRVKDLDTGRELAVPRIDDASGEVAWAADNLTLFYVQQEAETLRPYRVMRFRLDRPMEPPRPVFEETDSTFYCSIGRTRDERYLQIDLSSTLTTEVRLMDAELPTSTPTPFLPRESGHEYSLETSGDTVFVLSNWNAPNFRLFEASIIDGEDKATWRERIGERDDVLLSDVAVFDDFLVLEENITGISRLRVLARNAQADAGAGYLVDADEPAYVAAIDDNPDPTSRTLRYSYSSLKTPDTLFELDMETGERRQLKQDFAGPGFDADAYEVRRLSIDARDGEQIPVTLLHRRGTKPDGTHPTYLLGYGAYGIIYDPDFVSRHLSLVDRGFVFALAHLRGGQEKGRRWYDDGRLLNKLNTFNDFIDVADALVAQGWSAPDKLVGSGRSAGGLLIGAVANMRPDRFAALIAGVPFVDVITTMLDESIPLTTFEYDEWGDPRQRQFYDYMLAYSPYDQVSAQDYPHMLVTAGLWDPAVQYWEPAKWVAKLRQMKTDDNRLLLYTDMKAGHRGSAARFERLNDYALEYAFILETLGLAGTP